jgi:hypothetical protein
MKIDIYVCNHCNTQVSPREVFRNPPGEMDPYRRYDQFHTDCYQKIFGGAA